MANMEEQAVAQTGRRPDLRFVAQSPVSAATLIDSIAHAVTLDQEAETLYILHRIRPELAATRHNVASMRQNIATMRREMAEFRNAESDLRVQTAMLLDEVLRQAKNGIARAINRNAEHNASVLEPLFGLDGELVPNFPETLADAMALDHTTIRPILSSLGLDTTGELRTCKARFYTFIGLADER